MENFHADIQQLYRDKSIKVLSDPDYLLNMDYLTQFPSKIPRRINACLDNGREPKFAEVEVIKDDPTCQALIADATKCVEIKLFEEKVTKKHWTDATDYIKGVIKQYGLEHGRVCLRNVSVEWKDSEPLKMLRISILYGHYMYGLIIDD